MPALRIPLELVSSPNEQQARPATQGARDAAALRGRAGSSDSGSGDGSNGSSSASARLTAKAKPVPMQASRQRSPPAPPSCGPAASGARPAACTSAAAAAAAAAARAAPAGDSSTRWPRVVVPADIRSRLAAYPPAAFRSEWERLRTIFADISASLPQALLEEVGVKCASPTGQQLTWRCREQALMESAGWGVRGSTADTALANMTALEAHISSVEVRSVCARRAAAAVLLLLAGGLPLVPEARSASMHCSDHAVSAGSAVAAGTGAGARGHRRAHERRHHLGQAAGLALAPGALHE